MSRYFEFAEINGGSSGRESNLATTPRRIPTPDLIPINFFNLTQLQARFSFHTVALVDGVPGSALPRVAIECDVFSASTEVRVGGAVVRGRAALVD